MKIEIKKLRNHLVYYVHFIWGLKTMELKAMRQVTIILAISILIYKIDSYYLSLKKIQIIQKVANKPLPPLPKNTYQRGYSKNYPYSNSSYNYKRVDSNYSKQKIQNSININQADSATWVEMKGIGPSFAKRILKYRERLGGFYSIEQLKEVYGLDSNWVNENRKFLLIGEGIYKKVKVNSAEWKDFNHPYIPYKQINIVINYRKQHGPFNSYEDLKKISLFDSTLWVRTKYYLSFE